MQISWTRLDSLESLVKSNKDPLGFKEEFKAQLEFVYVEMSSMTETERKTVRERIRGLRQLYRQSCNDQEYSTPSKPSEVRQDLETRPHLIGYAQDLQKESLASLQSTVSRIHDTKEIGQAVATQLQQQSEQIQAVAVSVDELGEAQTRALPMLKRMLKRTASSRSVHVLTLSILICVILILVLKFSK